MGAGIRNHIGLTLNPTSKHRYLDPVLTYTPLPSPALEGTESGPSLEDHPHHQPLVMDPNPATLASSLTSNPLHLQ